MPTYLAPPEEDSMGQANEGAAEEGIGSARMTAIGVFVNKCEQQGDAEHHRGNLRERADRLRQQVQGS
jgi:hypothetical protein